MSYSLPDNLSLAGLRQYVTGTIAGLKAVPELAPLAPQWVTFKVKVRLKQTEREDADDLVIELSVQRRVVDARWDHGIVELSGRAYLASGKNVKELPYSALFGVMRAADAVKLGAARAVAFGQRTVVRGRQLAHPDLTATVESQDGLNQELNTVHTGWSAAREKALLFDLTRVQLLEEAELLIAQTEVEILTRFPGRRDLVAAILSPYRDEKKSRVTAGAGRAVVNEPVEPGEPGEPGEPTEPTGPVDP